MLVSLRSGLGRGTQSNSKPGGTPWLCVHVLLRHPTPGPDPLFPEPPWLPAGTAAEGVTGSCSESDFSKLPFLGKEMTQ